MNTKVQDLATTAGLRIPISDIRDSSLRQVASRIYQRDHITDEELAFVMDLDLATQITELQVSASETRRAGQYESNNYHASMKFDMAAVRDVVMSSVSVAAPEDKVTTFQGCKKTLYAFLAEKYEANEAFLRSIIHKQEAKDGIVR